MADEKLTRINVFLKECKIEAEVLPNSLIDYLMKIDDAIQSRKENLTRAKKIVKSNAINIKGISEDTNISRKTFYNHELLRLYVEKRATETNSEFGDADEQVKTLKSRVEQLEKEIRLFLLRDYETERLRTELIATQQLLTQSQEDLDELRCGYEKQLRDKGILEGKLKGKIIIPKDGSLGHYFGPQNNKKG